MSGKVTIEMKKFGRTLTDRADGKKACSEILMINPVPDILDFSGVIALGSSFGDEVIPVLAEKHFGLLYIKNANGAIASCIKKIIEDSGAQVEME